MIGKVFSTPERRFGELVEAAKELSTATLSAALEEPRGRDSLIASGALRRVSGSGVIAGHAVTAWSPAGNNTMIRFGMQAVEPGDVLVVATPSTGSAQWGDLATAWAVAAGVAAVIVYGSVRDVDAIRESGQSIWARDVDPRQAEKSSLGYVNGPVQVAGKTINPGDLIIADDDGVLVLGPDLAAKAVALGKERGAREEEVRRSVSDLASGVPKLMSIVAEPEFVSQTWEEWSRAATATEAPTTS